jgi:serine/threonine protein kinase
LNKLNKKFYAIKKISFNECESKKMLLEVKLLHNLRSEFVVKMKAFWVEKNYPIKRFDNICNLSSSRSLSNLNEEFLLHIQMKLYMKNLKELIKDINEILYKSGDVIKYYILCQLFKELLESVSYLHEHNPPIIHRDLKPSNIMVSDGLDGKFLKLADFGLVTYHEHDEQSHTTSLGTSTYMAPEVWISKHYNQKADIYSLGVIMREMFNIDVNKYLS